MQFKLRTAYQDLHPELEIVMLSEIAGPAFEEDKVFFTQEEITSRVSQFLRQEVNAPKVLNANLVIEAIEIQQGLLVQRATEVYSFSHLTIQEYLAANYYNQGRRRIQLIEKGLLSNRWREIFLLISGFSQADEFLLEMAEEAQRFVSREPEIQKLLTWVQSVVITGESAQNNALRRSAAMYCAIALNQAYIHSLLVEKWVQDGDSVSDKVVNALSVSDRRARRALGHILMLLIELSDADAEDCYLLATSVENLADCNFQRTANKISVNDISSMRKYAITLALEGVESWAESQLFRGGIDEIVTALKSLDVEQGFENSKDVKLSYHLEYLCKTCLGFNIRKEFSMKEMLKIEQYAYAAELIVECKKAALSVSTYGWTKVCSRLLSKS